MVPILSGDRVRLRGFTWADFPAFADMWAMPELTPFIPFAPVARAESWARLNGNSYAWVANGFGNWAVVDADNVFLGVTGFFRNPGAGMTPDYDAAIQSGWVFAAAARGRGIASEAVTLAHGWLDQQPFGGRSVCGMARDHAASIRVAEKAGYRVMGQADDAHGSVQLMERVIG